MEMLSSEISSSVIKENKTVAYTIADIAEWQDDIYIKNNDESISHQKISLPSLQRGFVWKPYQIESLWDSLLRGYPVGSILISKSAEIKELLDGQQRCTSIALGFVNPFDSISTQEIFNLKSNIPSVWIDLAEVKNSNYGLKFGIRVLTRSHPWGYQMINHRQPISASEREKALLYFRKKVGNSETSFSKLPINIISPWDCNYPIPLQVLLTCDDSNIEVWTAQVNEFISIHLKQIKTKHTTSDEQYVDYGEVSDLNFKILFEAVSKAKKILIPEIIIEKEVIVDEENDEENEDVTLFVRLNTEGTRISGEELIYSLLKATFPEAKILVEKIGLKYIAPSRIVNLFARLSLMQKMNFEHFQQDVNIVSFRKNLKEVEFVTNLKNFIGEVKVNDSDAQKIVSDAISILSINKDLPRIYIKEVVVRTPDLFLVLLVFLIKNRELSDEQKIDIHKGYHTVALFNTDAKTAAGLLFESLQKNGWTDWKGVVDGIKIKSSDIILPLIEPRQFGDFILNHLLPKFLEEKNTHFANNDLLKEIIKSNVNELNYLFVATNFQDNLSDEELYNSNVDNAAKYWVNLSEKIFKNRTFLVLAQRKYFKSEFNEFMEFDGIEDTNKPWDWDHIFPISWVHSRHGISQVIKWLIHTNGNLRALSFNENRSQSNHQSPSLRFTNNLKASENSYILSNDLEHWTKLTNEHWKLDKNSQMVPELAAAIFKRMINIYSDIYSLFNENKKII
jgi:uncharacterized protein with ParB-like and HNH nuclease domain